MCVCVCVSVLACACVSVFMLRRKVYDYKGCGLCAVGGIDGNQDDSHNGLFRCIVCKRVEYDDACEYKKTST